MAFDFPNAPTVGQTYSGYVWDGEKWVSTATSPNQSGVISIQVFTASGQYTPSANMTTCVIECMGGGGGGGGAGGGTTTTAYASAGGGAGGYSRKTLTAAAIGVAQSVVVGAKGTGGAGASGAPGQGGAGGVTSVGSLCVANGGTGGTGLSSSAAGGAGGVAGVGDVVLYGATAASIAGFVTTGTADPIMLGGNGAASMFGSPGAGGISYGTAAVGTPAVGYGAGGGGASQHKSTSTALGGAGAPGLVIVTEYGMTALSPATAQLGNVRYDLPQGLTANQTAQARANIWVTKKNYIVNGAMMVSQENGTTTLNPTSVTLYPVDMFGVFSANEGIAATAQVAVPTPGGSPTRLRLAVSTADAAVGASNQLQLLTAIEGLRATDLKLGTASAKTVTLQFGCKGPAGTYCVSFVNAANNRSYVVEYTIAAGEANTDVIKSVTLQLDTTGTWATDNTRGLQIIFFFMGGSSLQTATPNSWLGSAAYCTANQFNFMASTSNIFELFDVSLTEGNVAPPFQVPDYPSELALCKRYWQQLASLIVDVSGPSQSTVFPVVMRATPAVTGGGAGFTAAAVNSMLGQFFQTGRAYQNLNLNARL